MRTYFLFIAIAIVLSFLNWCYQSVHLQSFWVMVMFIVLFVLPLISISHGKIKFKNKFK